MSYKTFRFTELLVTIFLVILITLAVNNGIAWIPIPAAIVAVVALIILRRQAKEAITDERVDHIAGKAAMIAFQAGAFIMAFTGATFGALSHNSPQFQPYANSLIFSAGGLMVIFILGTLYYSGKLGGGGINVQ